MPSWLKKPPFSRLVNVAWPAPIKRLANTAILVATLALPVLGGVAVTLWPNNGESAGTAPANLPQTGQPQTGQLGADLYTNFKQIQTAALITAPVELTRITAVESLPLPQDIRRKIEVSSGDTLMALLVKSAVDPQDAHNAITALKSVFNPRKLKPGQEIDLAFTTTPQTDEAGQLVAINLRANAEQNIEVVRTGDDNFTATAIARPLQRALTVSQGTIDSSLYLAAKKTDLPTAILFEMVRAFSFDVDFQREIQSGDSFEVLYDRYTDETGELAKTGLLRYAALTLSGDRLEIYSFQTKDGGNEYFNGKGESVRKTLLRTPIDGARLSSGFGMRKHPVLGYSKMHRGTDFAARKGTPIYAAGDGVVEMAGRNGAYGNYVRLRHNASYKTAYAHTSRIADGIRKGKRVKQGQIIAYVGSTGRSTGPHLHYEVLKNGRQMNPLKVKMPSGGKLKGAELKRFQTVRAETDQLREMAPAVASVTAPKVSRKITTATTELK